MAKLQSKKTEIIMDTEEKAEKPDLKAQKSLDGDDNASDRGSVAEETNSHLFQELLDVVLKMKDNNGRMICELFLKLPPRQVRNNCIFVVLAIVVVLAIIVVLSCHDCSVSLPIVTLSFSLYSCFINISLM